MEEILLRDLFFYFAATALLIPIFRYLKLESILGYLSAGILLGPFCFDLIHHVENIQDISQLGIIMLMFVIGLELTPQRINHLKKTILLEGGSQFFVSSFLLGTCFLLAGLDLKISLLISAALALSSTAFSLTWLKENECLTKSYGQSSIGILIFQDLIIIPLLSIIPFFIPSAEQEGFSYWSTMTKTLLFIAYMAMSHFTILPLLKKIYDTQARDVFIAACLMFLLGSSLVVGNLGLSKALGAFVAGIFLSGSHLKTQIQSFSLPLKSMAMGVFFMSFGLTLDIPFFYENIFTLVALSFSLVAIKACVLLFHGLVVFRKWQPSLSLSLILSQGGEFGLLAIGLMIDSGLLNQGLGKMILSTVTLSIFLGPFMGKVILFMERKRVPDLQLVQSMYCNDDLKQDETSKENQGLTKAA